MNRIELIVMLTRNDLTVDNAFQIFDACKHSKAKFWGIKEESLSFSQMKELYVYMKQYNKTTFLEVVAYSEKECLDGAKMAADCGCDYLMGTKYFDSVNKFCRYRNLKYMPFVGEVTGRPSVLGGSIDGMIEEAKELLAKGVYGFDLLGYRYAENPVFLNNKFVSLVNAPVCIAGSVDSYQRLDEVINAAPWAFTIGSAFFENRFGDTFQEQIDKVCDYVSGKA